MKIASCRNAIVTAIREKKQWAKCVGEGTTSTFLKQVIGYDPKLIVYIKKVMGTRNLFGEVEFTIELSNLDIAFDELSIVRETERVITKLCACAGAFKKEVTFLCHKRIDPSAGYYRFHNEKATFYPALETTQIKRTTYPEYDYELVTVEMEYRIGTTQLENIERETDEEVDRISALLFSREMPDYVKVYLAHNYLTSTVVYSAKEERNSLEDNYIHSAYGALINKDCVCQGFAEAFKRLLDTTNVKCEVVSGRINKSGGYHAWNIVILGGKPYHVDSTWDGGKLKTNYTYFCVTDKYMREERTWQKHVGVACLFSGEDILQRAKEYVKLNKKQLLARGIPLKVLDC